MGNDPSMIPVSGDDIVRMAAVDSQFYESTFFPKTCRMAPASFHPALWRVLEASRNRLKNIQVTRDGAKTTKLRLFISKRIAYGVSRTILYVGKSDSHATNSLDWVRKQVMTNTRWAQTYGLEPGKTFNSDRATIINKTLDLEINILAAGINGSLRGLNIDDYRPDLIVLDDAIDDDNATTVLGRQKTAERIHGAIKESLAPATEAPLASLVMLNTPIAMEDASMVALTDPEWVSFRFSCWTAETEDGPIDQRMSSWEERYPTETLRAQKRMAMSQGRGHIFSREKECRIVSPETAPLRREWLRHYDIAPPRDQMRIVMAIDPVPKPSDKAIEKGLHRRDFEVHSVWGRCQSGYFLLDWLANRGHEPSWSVTSFWYLALKWRPRMICVEAVAYQATLAWILTQSMKEKGTYFVIKELQGERRSKKMRILDTFQPLGPAGVIHIPRHASDFEDQWCNLETAAHDDHIDAASMAVAELHGEKINEDLMAEYSVSYDRIPDSAMGCP